MLQSRCNRISTRLVFLLLSKHTPLERCCVHNMSPFVSSIGLSPGSREAKVQRAKVCLNCTEPSVARSSCWSFPVGRYLLDTRYKGSMVVLAWWTASNMARLVCWSLTALWAQNGCIVPCRKEFPQNSPSKYNTKLAQTESVTYTKIGKR